MMPPCEGRVLLEFAAPRLGNTLPRFAKCFVKSACLEDGDGLPEFGTECAYIVLAIMLPLHLGTPKRGAWSIVHFENYYSAD